MKAKVSILSLLFVAFAVFATTNSFAGNNGDFESNYKIAPVENFMNAQSAVSSWQITYGQSVRPVQVIMKSTKAGDEYLVRTKYFEVKYLNSDHGFGVRNLKASEQVVPRSLSDQVLNSKMLEYQHTISPNKIPQNQVLDMIASYLPDLVNPRYQNILN